MTPANQNLKPSEREGNPLEWMLTEDELAYLNTQRAGYLGDTP